MATPTDSPKNSDKPRPRQKQGLACAECRRRKLRCDGKQPNCGVCSDMGITCEQITVSAPRGPKKGHMRALQARMANIEARLQEQLKSTAAAADPLGFGFSDAHGQFDERLATPSSIMSGSAIYMAPDLSADMDRDILPAFSYNINPQISDLVRADLDQIYFERGHTFAPILQRRRYFSWANQPNKSDAQLALQYAMWALACAFSTQLEYMRTSLRSAAVRILSELEGREIEPHVVAVEHAQARVILLVHDFLKTSFDLAWIGAATCFRLLQYMRVYHIDSPHVASERIASPEKEDDVRTEEMRRAFWVAYSIDRFVNLRADRPLEFQEDMVLSSPALLIPIILQLSVRLTTILQISVRLPIPEDQFQSGHCPQQALFSDILASSFSEQGFCPFSESIIIATACGRAIQHKHQASQEDVYSCAPPGFWERHFWIEELLKARSRVLGLRTSPNVVEANSFLVFTKMTSHCTLLYLCKVLESKACITPEDQDLVRKATGHTSEALREIANLAYSQMHLSPFKLHPFTPLILGLCADFLEHRRSDMGISDIDIQQLVQLLSEMSSVNQLAKAAFSSAYIASTLAPANSLMGIM